MKRRLRSPCESCQPLSPTICSKPPGIRASSAPEAQLAADRLGLPQVFRARRPAPPHEQVEGEGLGEHVVLVELRRGDDPAPPAVGPSVCRSRPPSSSRPESGRRIPAAATRAWTCPRPKGLEQQASPASMRRLQPRSTGSSRPPYRKTRSCASATARARAHFAAPPFAPRVLARRWRNEGRRPRPVARRPKSGATFCHAIARARERREALGELTQRAEDEQDAAEPDGERRLRSFNRSIGRRERRHAEHRAIRAARTPRASPRPCPSPPTVRK